MCQEKGLSGDVSLGMLSAQVVFKAMMWGINPQGDDREESGPGPALDDPTLRVNLKPRLTWSPVQHCRGSDLTGCRGPGRDALLPF